MADHYAAVVELHFAIGWIITPSQQWEESFEGFPRPSSFQGEASSGIGSCVLHSFSEERLSLGSSCEAPSPQNAMSLSKQDEQSPVH